MNVLAQLKIFHFLCICKKNLYSCDTSNLLHVYTSQALIFKADDDGNAFMKHLH